MLDTDAPWRISSRFNFQTHEHLPGIAKRKENQPTPALRLNPVAPFGPAYEPGGLAAEPL
jgi:hypothetical protein